MNYGAVNPGQITYMFGLGWRWIGLSAATTISVPYQYSTGMGVIQPKLGQFSAKPLDIMVGKRVGGL